MTTDSSSNGGLPPDRDPTHTVSDGSVRSTSATDRSVDLGDRAMKARLAQRMFGADVTPPRIGRYRIERRVGAGGMGVVYEGFDEELERRVAIKLLHPELDERHAVRMRREALALAKMSHANVVHAYEIGVHEGALFLVMEFVPGEPLSRWQRAHRHHWKAILAKYVEAGQGLAAAHAAGIVHRDFKPSNVVVCDDGPARVLDFGLARSFGAIVDGEEVSTPLADTGSALDLRVTVTGTTMGTPAYMSPEQMLGQPTNAASDQFSFCVALYEGLYGERPFVAENATELYESLLFERVRPAPPGSRVPKRLRAIILRGLRARASQRHASMHDLLRALEGPAHPGRWRPLVALGTVASVGAVWSVLAADPPCENGALAASTDWSERRGAIAAAFAESEASYHASVVAGVDARIHEWARVWRDQYSAACAIQDEIVRRQRLTCLDEHRAAFAALEEVLARGGSGVVDHAFQLVDELPRADECSEAPRSSVHPNERAELLAARLDGLAGREADARAAASAVLERAQQLESKPLIGEALFTLAVIDLPHAPRSRVIDQLRRAAEAGLAADEPLLVADAWLEVARLEAADLRTLDQSREHARLARALLERRAGEGGELSGERAARLLRIEGEQAFATDDIGTAVEKLREAVAGLEAIHGQQHGRVTDAQLQLANALAVKGEHHEALRLYDSARNAMAGFAGAAYPPLHQFDYGIALVHLDLGEHENAAARLDDALRLVADAGPTWAWHRGRVLVALSQTFMLLGRVDDALQAARDARAELVASVPPDDQTRRGADGMLATLLQGMGDLDGSAEAFRSLAAGHEAANDHLAAAEVRAHLVAIELRRDRPADAAAVLDRHRDAIAERFGAGKVRVLEDAIAAMQALAAGDAASGRTALERVREAIDADEIDEQWCDVRAWATLALARSLAADDPERARALATEARAHLTETPHDPGLLADVDAFLGP